MPRAITSRDTPESVIELLAIARGSLEMFDSLQGQLRDATGTAVETAQQAFSAGIDRGLRNLAPRWNPQLRHVHERDLKRGTRNPATPAVARKLAEYLWAVGTSRRPFVPRRQDGAV